MTTDDDACVECGAPFGECMPWDGPVRPGCECECAGSDDGADPEPWHGTVYTITLTDLVSMIGQRLA